jgi:putative addiction module component (TIGR02574 family)
LAEQAKRSTIFDYIYIHDHHVRLTTAQQAELEQRLTTLDHDRTQNVTWETLKAELEQRCP